MFVFLNLGRLLNRFLDFSSLSLPCQYGFGDEGESHRSLQSILGQCFPNVSMFTDRDLESDLRMCTSGKRWVMVSSGAGLWTII